MLPRSPGLRAIWNRRTTTWHEHVVSSPAFGKVREVLVAKAALSGVERVVDLGAGTGFISLALAPMAGTVLAVDLSDGMLSALREEATAQGRENLSTRLADLASFDLPAHSVDLVVSSYALHHLRDEDKRRLVGRMHEWLAPGGRVVVADMMFGRGRTARDRRVIVAKVSALARKGPGGLWRIAKNLVRFGLARGTELPSPPEFWLRAFHDAGFVDVQFEAIVAEAGLLTAVAGESAAI